MIEVVGNLWTYSPCDVRVITTNGTVKKNGECVMGRGCALEAKRMFPSIAEYLGDCIRRSGNHVHFLVGGNTEVWSFPVKHQWMEKADPALIYRSAEELRAAVDERSAVRVVVMPRPGCGNGQLLWTDVRKVLSPILDDRFHVIHFG